MVIPVAIRLRALRRHVRLDVAPAQPLFLYGNTPLDVCHALAQFIQLRGPLAQLLALRAERITLRERPFVELAQRFVHAVQPREQSRQHPRHRWCRWRDLQQLGQADLTFAHSGSSGKSCSVAWARSLRPRLCQCIALTRSATQLSPWCSTPSRPIQLLSLPRPVTHAGSPPCIEPSRGCASLSKQMIGTSMESPSVRTRRLAMVYAFPLAALRDCGSFVNSPLARMFKPLTASPRRRR